MMYDKKQSGRDPDAKPVIQLHSVVTIREFYGKRVDTFQLALPEKPGDGHRYLSMDDPLAQKILGKKEGDLFEHRVISGALKTFLILEVK